MYLCSCTGFTLAMPVVALSYERKVGAAMKAMGCEKYCMDIDTFTPNQALDSTRELLSRRREVSEAIGRSVDNFRRQVDDQYDVVFGSVS